MAGLMLSVRATWERSVARAFGSLDGSLRSCAMMQLLRACVAQEEMWAEPILAPEQLSERPTLSLSVSERRMQQTGRTTLIKVERGRGHRLPKLVEDVIDLTV